MEIGGRKWFEGRKGPSKRCRRKNEEKKGNQLAASMKGDQGPRGTAADRHEGIVIRVEKRGTSPVTVRKNKKRLLRRDLKFATTAGKSHISQETVLIQKKKTFLATRVPATTAETKRTSQETVLKNHHSLDSLKAPAIPVGQKGTSPEIVRTNKQAPKARSSKWGAAEALTTIEIKTKGKMWMKRRRSTAKTRRK